MNVVIITCSRNGTASRCLERIVLSGVNVQAVIVARGLGVNKKRALWRCLKKIAQIGVLGAVNGLRLRKWYSAPVADIENECKRLSVPFLQIDGLNSIAMEQTLRNISPDLGVSLGNGYIAPRIFEIPRLGMINLHTEILPAYQNAQAIIWPIYCNDPYTGYTIHEIVRTIDAGRILLQRKYPLEFCARLEDTVRKNKAITDSRYPEDVAYVIKHIEELKKTAVVQGKAGRYTTPSFWQFLRMVRNNRRFYKQQVR